MTVNGGADIPFISSANPVMSIITFLSQAVQPEVASAAAQAALKSILKNKTSDKMELEHVKENGVDHSNDKSKLDTPFTENDQDMLKAAAAAALGTAAVKAKVRMDTHTHTVRITPSLTIHCDSVVGGEGGA